MHCRRKVLPVAQCSCSYVRSTSTALKLKPRSWDPAPEPAVVPPPNQLDSKWAHSPTNSTLPSTSGASSAGHANKWAVQTNSQALKPSSADAVPKFNEWTSATSPSTHTRGSPSATLPRPNLSKWAFSPYPPTSSSGLLSDTNMDVPSTTPSPRISPSQSTAPSPQNLYKWPSQPPPTSKWVNSQASPYSSPSSPTPAPPPKRPSNISQTPPSSALKKWARTVAPVTSVQQTRVEPEQGTSQQYQTPQQNASRRYTPRSDPRLQRDVAPHQAPFDSTRFSQYTIDGSARRRSSVGTAVLQHREKVRDRVFGTPPPDSWRDHDRLSRARAGGEVQTTEPPNKLPMIREETPLESVADLKNGRKTRGGWSNRDGYKERGSLLSPIREDVAIPNHSRTPPAYRKLDPAKVKRKRDIRGKRVSVDVYIPSTVTVGTLARLLNVRLERLQRQMRLAGMAEEATYDYVLTSDYAVLLAEEFGRNPIVNDEAAFDIYPSPPDTNQTTLPSRPPVVTIMGHVDHGKTTLLDTLRSSSVAKGEAGGITQHIGAFSVPVPSANGSADSRSITFLDTPGHAAFSAMRARGAGVTDIVVLVIAADDGIKPQTREVIELIKKDEGKVGVVVAINKVDKPGADVDSVQKALMAESIQLEVFGGDVPSVEVSGLTGHRLPQLVETLSAMAEVQDLRAERDGPVHGYILESKVHKGLGPVATVLVLRGCLMPGSHIISGVSQAKVRGMNDPTGASIKAAYPGMAITVSGWKSIPNAGDEVLQGSEADIKKAVVNRRRKIEIEASLVDVEAINANRRHERERRELEAELGEDAKELVDETPSGPKELRLIVKGDVSGSVEAVVGALQGIGNDKAAAKIVSSGVGDVSESDVMMAKAVGGTVVGFSVSTPRAIEILAAQNNVPTCSSSIIYSLMDEIKNRVIALLPIITEKKVTGEATVLQLFDIQLKAKQTKKVAGCRVVNGIIEKARHARVVRDGVTMHEGSLDTMRHLKKDVIEVRKGLECGLSFCGFGDLREGDLIQMYQKIEKPGVL